MMWDTDKTVDYARDENCLWVCFRKDEVVHGKIIGSMGIGETKPEAYTDLIEEEFYVKGI